MCCRVSMIKYLPLCFGLTVGPSRCVTWWGRHLVDLWHVHVPEKKNQVLKKMKNINIINLFSFFNSQGVASLSQCDGIGTLPRDNRT